MSNSIDSSSTETAPTGYTFDEQIVSDVHKEAFGFRPTQGWWAHWKNSNNDQKQDIWDDLIVSMERAHNEEKERERRACNAVENALVEAYIAGARDRVTAIRWWWQNFDTNSRYFDPEHAIWTVGLLGTKLEKELIAVARMFYRPNRLAA
jgi:hypothetical protein